MADPMSGSNVHHIPALWEYGPPKRFVIEPIRPAHHAQDAR